MISSLDCRIYTEVFKHALWLELKIYCITAVLEESFVKSVLILQIFVTTIGICWYKM